MGRPYLSKDSGSEFTRVPAAVGAFNLASAFEERTFIEYCEVRNPMAKKEEATFDELGFFNHN